MHCTERRRKEAEPHSGRSSGETNNYPTRPNKSTIQLLTTPSTIQIYIATNTLVAQFLFSGFQTDSHADHQSEKESRGPAGCNIRFGKHEYVQQQYMLLMQSQYSGIHPSIVRFLHGILEQEKAYRPAFKTSQASNIPTRRNVA